MTASDTYECGYDYTESCKNYNLARMLNEEYLKRILKIFEEE